MDTLFEPWLAFCSRRAFLRHLRDGALGLFWLPLIELSQGAEKLVTQPEITPDLGRTLRDTVEVYKKPSFSADLVKTYPRDTVLPITAATVGDQNPPHNRVWYLLGNEGYAHSGAIQPVAQQLNPPLTLPPRTRRLVEVTVPFTDALWNPDRPRDVAYRLYYSATFWVSKVVLDRAGSPWYRIPDDIWDYHFYARAEHFRPVEPQDLEPISPQILPAGKRIEVRLADQVVIAYEGDRPVFMARTSSGARFASGDYSTQPGTFVTSRKRPSRHMAAGSPATSSSGYDLPGVPWVSYLTETGVAFHGTYWHNDYGRPRSHGCLNLSPSAARWIYRWTLPHAPYYEPLVMEDSGTRVDVMA